ncbi:hypothetical protein ACFQZJ_11280 [Maribacter chungangensis]|uniref:Uncharacterized protein n=1 Tax=Maribacter chungangensis TaxID=1069117 RepID=A0ABW3B402_9FLAO
MKVATRPKEIIYFFFVPVQTQQGTAYFFNAMDAYSEYVIDLGTSLSIDGDTIISHIKKLLKHRDFKRSPKKPFTLVCNLDGDIQQRIRAILLPEKGKLVVDADAVQENTKSFRAFFDKKRE